MEYELTEHARVSLTVRSNILLGWLERVLENPQQVEPDPTDLELEHRLGRIDEYDGRVLRVIVKATVTPLRVVTVYFDRNMRGKL